MFKLYYECRGIVFMRDMTIRATAELFIFKLPIQDRGANLSLMMAVFFIVELYYTSMLFA